MPLDVQPLSPARRAAMILLMAALLASSLGFAQWLIARREEPVEISVRFPPPQGLTDMPVNTSEEQATMGTLLEGRVAWPQGVRHLCAFYFAQTQDASPQDYLEALLDRILPDPAGRPLSFLPAQMGGVPGLEVQRQVGRREDSTFAIIRLAQVDNHIIAFSFSGDGVITDADKQFFDSYCTRQIEIHLHRTTRKG